MQRQAVPGRGREVAPGQAARTAEPRVGTGQVRQWRRAKEEAVKGGRKAGV